MDNPGFSWFWTESVRFNDVIIYGCLLPNDD